MAFPAKPADADVEAFRGILYPAAESKGDHMPGNIDETVARRGVAAVSMTLGEAVPGTEFQDLMSQLPNEFQNI
ncbi:hypothetical protein [Streptomyces sp. NPDC047869]|uniref:hypothetical protein n=1 Tax=Streptomyces sp. NPDC047869 TaxID=3154709 RepID=UPI0034546E6F